MPYVTKGSIDAMHQRLSVSFGLHLQGECEVAAQEAARANWHRRLIGEEVGFYLWSRKVRQVLGRRGGGRGTCPIVPAVARSDDWEADEFAWAGWREIWIRKGHDQFEMKEAAFTFFWGRASAVAPVENQLLRAEWPQKGYAGKRSGQPHWQVDWPLADLTTVASGIHLGMAGWDREEQQDPEGKHVSDHFTRYATNTVDDVETWASRTMEYSLDQISRFYPKEMSW